MIGEDGVTVRTGAVATKETTIPWNRIASIDVKRDLLDLLFRLYRLDVYAPLETDVPLTRIRGLDKVGIESLTASVIARVNGTKFGIGEVSADNEKKHRSLCLAVPRKTRAVISRCIRDVFRVSVFGAMGVVFVAPFAVRVLASLPASMTAWVDRAPAFVWIAIVGLVIVFALYEYFFFRRSRYELNDASLTIHRGAFFSSRTILPLSSVVGIKLERSALDELFRLYNVRILSCSEEDSHMKVIEGLGKDESASVRNVILRRVDSTSGKSSTSGGSVHTVSGCKNERAPGEAGDIIQNAPTPGDANDAS